MEKNNSLKLNNKGLSLLELIVVIAIMAVIGTASYLATSVATDKHVSSCANKISASIEQTRSITLGKRSGYILIWQDPGNDVFCQMYVDGKKYGNEASIGHSGLTVTVNYTDGTNAVLSSLGASNPVMIEFSRSNGGVISSPAVSSFTVTNTRMTWTVKIDTYTGRVECYKEP